MKDFYLYNSLSKQKELFKPVKDGYVGMYSCGFTVYDHTHIGHIKKYVGDDILRRVLMLNGYDVKYVQNVTDVGHLTSDADFGEDKLEKGAKKYEISIEELARSFETEFYESLKKVNVLAPTIVERAASNNAIVEQKKFIQILLDKGFAYIKEKAIYFDVSKLDEYNPFSDQKLEDKLIGKREDVEVDPEKRNPSDFVLWMFTKGKYENHIMKWDAPWGEGFPGWHIECSAISMENLGDHIDIHTGGIDHLEIHHPNEIAQNYGICGHKVVNYWVHHNFLTVDGKKMSKSLNNFYTVTDILEKGYSPIALRYLMLGTHYRKQINFTWEAITGAENTLNKLYDFVDSTKEEGKEVVEVNDGAFYDEFIMAVNDDLNMPVALAVVWKLIKSTDVNNDIKLGLLKTFDKVLGLNLFDRVEKDAELEVDTLAQDIKALLNERNMARKDKSWELSDKIRDVLKEKGYVVIDDEKGTKILKK